MLQATITMVGSEHEKSQLNREASQPTQIPEPNRDPSKVLLISNLQRPFIQSGLNSLLSEHGKVLDLWITKRKTHAIVKFATSEEAKTARNNLYNVKWPETGKYLILDYIDESEIESLKEKCENGLPLTDIVNKDASGQEQGENANQEGPNKRELAAQKRDAQKALRVRRRGEKMEEEYGDRAEAMTEISKIFKKTICKPQIFYMPNSKEKAEKILSLRNKQEEVREKQE